MDFETPLSEGRFLRRYKRFFADIEFQGETITAHCPNTGSMKGCQEEGALCLFSHNDDPKRKLKYTLEMIKTKESWVGLHTGRPNKLVEELYLNSPLPHWQKWDRHQMEVKINDQSRLDMMLWNSQHHDLEKWKPKTMTPPCHLIEIKNTTMRIGNTAAFPDAVTTRGQKHILELIKLQEEGFTTELVFTVNREDCTHFAPADEIDPEYGRLLREAIQAGVKITPLRMRMDKTAIALTGEKLPLDI